MPGKVQTWNIDLINETEETHRLYADLINLFIFTMDSSKSVISIDHNKKHKTFIESWLSSVINFHINRLNIPDKDNIFSSIWVESKPYDFDYIHTHIDHNDLDIALYGKHIAQPILSCVTFFDDSNVPFISTDITRDMALQNDFNNINNKTITVELPRALKHISFDGGKYYHGEGYLEYPYSTIPRKKIVIALWRKKQTAIPYFDIDNFVLQTFKHDSQKIDINQYKNITQHVNQVHLNITPRNKIKIIQVTNNNDINYKFFLNLITFKYKNVCCCLLKHIQEYINDYDSFVLDFSKLTMINKSSMFKTFINGLNIYNIQNNYEVIAKKNVFHCYDNEVLLNLYSKQYNSTEKYVYELFSQYMDKLGIVFDNSSNCFNKNVWVSFYICNSMTITNNADHNTVPLISLHTNYYNNTDKNYFTNLTCTGNTTITSKKPICIVNNNPNTLTSFDSKYIHSFSENSLIINIWDVKPTHLKLSNIESNLKFNKGSNISITKNGDIDIHKCTSNLLLYTIDNIFNKKNYTTTSFDDYLSNHNYLSIKPIDELINHNISGMLQDKVYFDADNVTEFGSNDAGFGNRDKYPVDPSLV